MCKTLPKRAMSYPSLPLSKWRMLLWILSCMGFSTPMMASHLAGGEITYRHLSGQMYEFTMRIYRDCSGISFPNPAPITIHQGATLVSNIDVPLSSSQLIPNPATHPDGSPLSTCLEEGIYVWTTVLPAPNADNYSIQYNSCCRNGSILNLAGDDFRLVLEITPAAVTLGNSGPAIQPFRQTVVCQNTPLQVNMGANDPNGDRITYEFCASQPTALVAHIAPFTATNPFGGSPVVQINPTTGLITGTMPNLGVYQGTICIKEFRGVTLLSTTNRDIQFDVEPCVATACFPPILNRASATTTSNAMTVQWIPGEDLMGCVLNYRVEWKLASTPSWTGANSATTTATTFTATGLLPDKDYDFRIFMICCNRTQVQGGMITLHTLNAACRAPNLALRNANITATGISIRWIDGVDDQGCPICYLPQWKLKSATTWTSAITFKRNYTVTGLQPAQDYDFRVSIKCCDGTVVQGAPLCFRTQSLLCDAKQYEPNNTFQTAKTIPNEGTIFASISQLSDIDWYQFTAVKEKGTITLLNVPNMVDYAIGLYDAWGVPVATATRSTLPSCDAFYDPDVAYQYTLPAGSQNRVMYLKINSTLGYNSSYCYGLRIKQEAIGLLHRENDLELKSNITVFPNPVQSALTVDLGIISEPISVTVSLVDPLNRLVSRMEKRIENNDNLLEINTQRLTNGFYWVTIQRGQEEVVTRKIWVAHEY